MNTEGHHVLPVSMDWPHKTTNILRIQTQNHKLLHKEQNVSQKLIRRYREKTNWRLIQTPYTLDQKWLLWKAFFSGAKNVPEHIQKAQARVLGDLTDEEFQKLWRWEKVDRLTLNPLSAIDDRIEQIIELQKQQVNKLIQGRRF